MLTLYIEQDEALPLSVLPFAFVPNHPTLKRLIDHCQDPEVARKFRDIARGATKRAQFAPAERLIAGVFNSPAFVVRCGRSFDLPRLLSRGGFLVVEGGSLGNLSDDAMRTMMGAGILQVIHYVRNRKRPYPRVRMAIDEATNANLIGLPETRAMAECQKMGLDIDILVQSPNFGSPFILDAVLTNCIRHEWFYAANSAVASTGAADLGDPSYKSRLMQLQVGERFVKQHNKVYFERVQPLEDPWCFPGLAARKAGKALREIRARPEYQNGEAVTVQSTNDSKSIPAPSSSSPTSSPALRLRTEGSPGSASEKK